MQIGKVKKHQEDQAETRARSRSVMNGAGLSAKARDERRTDKAMSAAVLEHAVAFKGQRDALKAHAAARRAVEGARGDLAGAAMEARNLKPEGYSDSRYWEQRHAKSREGDETYEWYTGYPEEALREVKSPFVRTFLPACTVCASHVQFQSMRCDKAVPYAPRQYCTYVELLFFPHTRLLDF